VPAAIVLMNSLRLRIVFSPRNPTWLQTDFFDSTAEYR
jgi:hypothetical protein